ncbi:hypothetical protein PanWU01x14_099150, partial [Parasponia andersonii]
MEIELVNSIFPILMVTIRMGGPSGSTLNRITEYALGAFLNHHGCFGLSIPLFALPRNN